MNPSDSHLHHFERSGRQVTATNAADVATWINAKGGCSSFDALSDGVLVSTPDDDLMAYPGDWVLLVAGEFSVFGSVDAA